MAEIASAIAPTARNRRRIGPTGSAGADRHPDGRASLITAPTSASASRAAVAPSTKAIDSATPSWAP